MSGLGPLRSGVLRLPLVVLGGLLLILFAPPGLECLAQKVKEAQDLATKIVESCIEVRKQRFSSWVQEQSAGGAGALHKFVKPRQAWAPHGAYEGPQGSPPHPAGPGRRGSPKVEHTLEL